MKAMVKATGEIVKVSYCAREDIYFKVFNRAKGEPRVKYDPCELKFYGNGLAETERTIELKVVRNENGKIFLRSTAPAYQGMVIYLPNDAFPQIEPDKYGKTAIVTIKIKE